MICASCRQENPEGFGFCGRCGSPLATKTEQRRKPATLLFCDASGSTAMGERLDAESVRELNLAALVLALAGAVALWWLPWPWALRLVAFVAAFLVVAELAHQRGNVCARAFAATLFSPRGKPSKLRDIEPGIDHVLCATELHSGEHVYFSGRFVVLL